MTNLTGALESKVDKLLDYMRALEKKNAILERQSQNDQQLIDQLQAEREALSKQLMVLATSLER